MEKVIMRINAHQETNEGKEDVMELVTQAKRYDKGKVVYLIYEETELSGMPGCVTSIKIDGNVVKLRRYGVKSHEMHFEVGKHFYGVYQTPTGYFDMEILTTKIKSNFAKGGQMGKLLIEYDISLKGFFEAHNSLEVRVVSADC